MADGWDADEINAGIARLQSLHAVVPRRAAKVPGAPSGAPRPEWKQPVAESHRLPVGKFRPDPPGFSRHWLKHRDNDCPKCRYARNRSRWKRATRMLTSGLPHSWLKVKAGASPAWGIGCSACRWYCLRSGLPGAKDLGNANPFVHMKLAGCSVQVCHLHRHARTRLHRLATEALRNSDAAGFLPAPAACEFQALLDRLRAGGLESTCRGDS
jgi:hypothetical protein